MRITQAHAKLIEQVNKELADLGVHHPVEGEAEQRFIKIMDGAGFCAEVIKLNRSVPASELQDTFTKWAWAGDAKHNLAYGLGVLHACYKM